MENDEHDYLFQEISGDVPLVLRIGSAPQGPEAGRIGMLNSLARSRLPVPEGMVLTEDSHRRFLESSGLVWDILASGDEAEVHDRVLDLRQRYRRCTLEAVLRGVIRTSLAELGGRTVAVVSGYLTCTGLRSIPLIEAAVLRAWISIGGLKRQVEAAIRSDEIPLWPVLIHRELHDG